MQTMYSSVSFVWLSLCRSCRCATAASGRQRGGVGSGWRPDASLKEAAFSSIAARWCIQVRIFPHGSSRFSLLCSGHVGTHGSSRPLVPVLSPPSVLHLRFAWTPLPLSPAGPSSLSSLLLPSCSWLLCFRILAAPLSCHVAISVPALTMPQQQILQGRNCLPQLLCLSFSTSGRSVIVRFRFYICCCALFALLAR